MTEEHEVVIQFRNVTKNFDLFKNDKQRLKSLLFHNTNAKKKVAIDNLSFDIRQGEAVAILGKNGAGKSTMLKMISGVTFPTVGSVRVTGRVSALLEASAPNMELAWDMDDAFLRRLAALGARMKALGVIAAEPDYSRLVDRRFVDALRTGQPLVHE